MKVLLGIATVDFNVDGPQHDFAWVEERHFKKVNIGSVKERDLYRSVAFGPGVDSPRNAKILSSKQVKDQVWVEVLLSPTSPCAGEPNPELAVRGWVLLYDSTGKILFKSTATSCAK